MARGARRRSASAMPTSAIARRTAKNWQRSKHETQSQAHPLRRHRRRRHERHRRGAAQPRLHGVRLGPGQQRRHASAWQTWARKSCIGHAADNIDGADAVVTSTAVQAGQPRSGGRARRADPGRAARDDAGRADAPEAGHRDRRHARQDHHHQPGRERAGRGRPRPDLRDRRPPEQRRRQRQAGHAATTSWSRPTSPTPRS